MQSSKPTYYEITRVVKNHIQCKQTYHDVEDKTFSKTCSLSPAINCPSARMSMVLLRPYLTTYKMFQ